MAAGSASSCRSNSAPGRTALIRNRDAARPARQRAVLSPAATPPCAGSSLDRLGTPDTIDTNGFPIGGNGLVILNAELRRAGRGGLGVVGFVDSGNVFANASHID